MGQEAPRLFLALSAPPTPPPLLEESQCISDSLTQAEFLSENAKRALSYMRSGYCVSQELPFG